MNSRVPKNLKVSYHTRCFKSFPEKNYLWCTQLQPAGEQSCRRVSDCLQKHPGSTLLVCERRLLWSTLRWPCTKIECQKVPLCPKLAQVRLPHSPEIEKLADLELSSQVWPLDFRFQIATLPHPQGNAKFAFQFIFAEGCFTTLSRPESVSLSISRLCLPTNLSWILLCNYLYL